MGSFYLFKKTKPLTYECWSYHKLYLITALIQSLEMIVKRKLTKVTLENNADEIVVFLGGRFLMIIMLIEMIKTIMKGKLQEPEQNISSLQRG